MGLSYRAATKPADYSFLDVLLPSEPNWGANLTQLHILRCLLHSATAINYTPSHGRGKGRLPPIPIPISADPSPLPCCHSHFTTTPAVTSHIGSCQAPERIRRRTTGATNAILGLISSPPTRVRQFSIHLLRDFFLEIYELLRLPAHQLT
jgi:hypothetical protein